MVVDPGHKRLSIVGIGRDHRRRLLRWRTPSILRQIYAEASFAQLGKTQRVGDDKRVERKPGRDCDLPGNATSLAEPNSNSPGPQVASDCWKCRHVMRRVSTNRLCRSGCCQASSFWRQDGHADGCWGQARAPRRPCLQKTRPAL